MTDLAKPMRGWMAERFIVGRPQVMEAQVSTDGTRKWLLRSDDGQDYEMVFIPDADRGTLCVSRSEAHTSELPSLLRTSYAVFCLTPQTPPPPNLLLPTPPTTPPPHP